MGNHKIILSRVLIVCSTVLFTVGVFGQTLKVYGYIPGASSPEALTLQQVKKLTTTHGGVSTGSALVSGLNTSRPILHIIDTKYFETFDTEYGTHQAYAQEMGLVSGPEDFIKKLKANGSKRSIMPFTFYVLRNSLSVNGKSAKWVLQNRRYIFKDNSRSFVNSLVKSQELFRKRLGSLVSGKPLFITYELAESTRRPNLLTDQGLRDIEVLESQGFGVIRQEEISN